MDSEITPRDFSQLRAVVLLETLLVEHKCEQTIPSIYQLSTRKYQACNKYGQ